MADGFGSAGANTALNALLAAYPWIQLHTGAPGAAGTANVATTSTRKTAAWNSASGGSATNNGAIGSWTAAATETATHFTAWSASTSGNFGVSGSVTGGAMTSGQLYQIADTTLTVSATLAS